MRTYRTIILITTQFYKEVILALWFLITDFIYFLFLFFNRSPLFGTNTIRNGFCCIIIVKRKVSNFNFKKNVRFILPNRRLFLNAFKAIVVI